MSWGHRRRMETEAKAKVVASDWGAKCVQFLAALAVLPRSTGKKRIIQPLLPNRPRQNRRNDLCLLFCLHPSSMVWVIRREVAAGFIV